MIGHKFLYRLEVYDGTQDLEDWYEGAAARGFYNNHNKTVLIDYIDKHEDATLILLYYKDRVIGTTITHSLRQLGILGKDAHRIAARTALLIERVDDIRGHKVHNNDRSPMNHHTSQMLTPACFYYLGLDKPMYVSTNNLETASQRKVHRTWAKIMHRHGYLKDPFELEYKGAFQTFWKVDVEHWLSDLSKVQWPESKAVLDVFAAQLKKV